MSAPDAQTAEVAPLAVLVPDGVSLVMESRGPKETVTTILVNRSAASGHSDWRYSGSCVGLDPEMFFPVGTLAPAAALTKRAKRICRTCPVMLECLDWALRSGLGSGVWGGLSGDERRGVLVARRPPVPGDTEVVRTSQVE